ncbi:hypothetical protein TNIN_180911 [Trichonephila inaurata madagascariensis]|uniref:Uncharacterized protein n=1 Tax=Trichonephila inaurata madagascariensis TaxID=2747483 RepID=A0A8X6MJ31_9ARAC|nr:hypothetical protein TNIN_180911 [Trichonephila inaurata madagascariensis]
MASNRSYMNCRKGIFIVPLLTGKPFTSKPLELNSINHFKRREIGNKISFHTFPTFDDYEQDIRWQGPGCFYLQRLGERVPRLNVSNCIESRIDIPNNNTGSQNIALWI